MQLTITGYSTALFSTWYFIEEWGICFDAGDGLISALLQKSRKIDHVFISHADRDHLTGLLQFNQLNARPGYPIMHYPVDAASFLALERFSKAFDPQVDRTVWLPATAGEGIAIAKDLLVLPARNGHVPVEQHVIKSLGVLSYRPGRSSRPSIHISPVKSCGNWENVSVEKIYHTNCGRTCWPIRATRRLKMARSGTIRGS